MCVVDLSTIDIASHFPLGHDFITIHSDIGVSDIVHFFRNEIRVPISCRGNHHDVLGVISS